MDTYTGMVGKVVRVQQTVWLLLAQQYNFTNYTTALYSSIICLSIIVICHFSPLPVTALKTLYTWP